MELNVPVVKVDSVAARSTPQMFCLGPGMGPNATGILRDESAGCSNEETFYEELTASRLKDFSPRSIFVAPASNYHTRRARSCSLSSLALLLLVLIH